LWGTHKAQQAMSFSLRFASYTGTLGAMPRKGMPPLLLVLLAHVCLGHRQVTIP
jgi:hypothetical protein